MSVPLKHLKSFYDITERKMAMEIIKKTMPSGEPYIINYLHAKSAAMGKPVSTTFELTPRCNFNCKMCYIHTADCNCLKNEELTAQQWIDLGRQAKDAGVLFVLLTGGEPLIRSDFREIFTALKNMGLLVSVNTNASLIDDEMFEFFKNDPPERLNISLYGASEETYTNLCGGAYYNKVLNNIKRLVEAGIKVVLNLSLTPYNEADKEKILEIAEELKLNIRSTPYIYPPVRRQEAVTGENPARFTSAEAARVKTEYDLLRFGKEEFLKRAERLKNGSLLDTDTCCDPSAEGESMKCRAGKSTCWLNYKGKMSVCGMFGNDGYDTLSDGFLNCWQRVMAERNAIRTPAGCVDCRYRKMCPACASMYKSETGSFDKIPEYICEFSKALLENILKTAEELKNEA